MSECKQKYIEWSSENGNYCGEYDNGRLIGTDAVNEFDGWEAAWNHQQAKIDELKKLRSLDEMTISQLAQANQVWQSKCNELQARVDSLTNINESLVAYKNQLLDEIEEKGNKDEN